MPRILRDAGIVQRLTLGIGAKPIAAGDDVDALSRFYPPDLAQQGELYRLIGRHPRQSYRHQSPPHVYL